MLNNYLNLNALLKVEGFEAKGNVVEMNSEDLTVIDNAIKACKDEIQNLKADTATKETRIAELENKIKELSEQPAETTKQVEPTENNVTASSMFNVVKDLI